MGYLVRTFPWEERPFDRQFTEVEVKDFFLGPAILGEVNGYCLFLAVVMGGEIEKLGSLGPIGDIVFPIPGDGRYRKAFDVVLGRGWVPINGMVDLSLIPFFPHIYMQDLFPHKGLLLNPGNQIFAICAEDNDVINI